MGVDLKQNAKNANNDTNNNGNNNGNNSNENDNSRNNNIQNNYDVQTGNCNRDLRSYESPLLNIDNSIDFCLDNSD